MRKILASPVLLLLLFLLSACLKQQQDPPINKLSKKYPSPPDTSYHLVWYDDFNGTQLDTTKWNYRALGKRRDGWNSKDAISLDGNGNLVITAFVRNDSIFTGMIGTQGIFEQRYGYFECRAKFEPGYDFYWPAFWMQSPLMGNGGSPDSDGAEIDIMEHFFDQGPEVIRHTIVWGGYGQNMQSIGNNVTLPVNPDQFHTYGFEWTPDYYKFYVDGYLSWTVNSHISGVPEYIILSCEVQNRYPQDGPINLSVFPIRFVIDYVKAYKSSKY